MTYILRYGMNEIADGLREFARISWEQPISSVYLDTWARSSII